MNINEHNRTILRRLCNSINLFASGDLGLEEIHSMLQSALAALENDGTAVVEVVRLAEADVEEIRFTRLLEEQRAAIILRLEELRSVLSE